MVEMMFECVPLASLQIYTWFRYGEQKIVFGYGCGGNCKVKTYTPYVLTMQVSAAFAVASAAVTIAHLWEGLDEGNLPALAAKRRPFLARAWLQLYITTDTTIRIAVLAIAGVAFHSAVWGVVLVFLVTRLCIWVWFIKDPDKPREHIKQTGEGVNDQDRMMQAAELGRQEASRAKFESGRSMGFKCGTGAFFAPAMLCHDFFVEEANGLEKGRVRTFRPLLVQLFCGAFETFAVASVHCFIPFHPSITMGCACRAPDWDRYIREDCLLLDGPDDERNINSARAPMGTGGRFIALPLIALGALWFVKILSLVMLARIRSSHLRQPIIPEVKVVERVVEEKIYGDMVVVEKRRGLNASDDDEPPASDDDGELPVNSNVVEFDQLQIEQAKSQSKPVELIEL
jgi:hypothetical protein